jgi:hypothetical protein
MKYPGVKICHNVRFADSSACMVYDDDDRITESVKSGTEVFV